MINRLIWQLPVFVHDIISERLGYIIFRLANTDYYFWLKTEEYERGIEQGKKILESDRCEKVDRYNLPINEYYHHKDY